MIRDIELWNRPGEEVWIPDKSSSSEIETALENRSYQVRTPLGTVRRNHRNLNRLPPRETQTEPDPNEVTEPNGVTESNKQLQEQITPLSQGEVSDIYKHLTDMEPGSWTHSCLTSTVVM